MDSSKPIIVAHRGASFDAPENTLAAINLAWERGAQAVEIDIQLSKDKEIIVIHDYNTLRTAGHDEEVKQQYLIDLKKLDAGHWKGKNWKNERIPTLKEVFDTVPPNRILVVEIKDGPDIIPALVAQINDSTLSDEQINIIGFDLHVIKSVKDLLPNHKVLLLSEFSPKMDDTQFSDIIEQAAHFGLDGVNFQAVDAIDSRHIRLARERHLLIFVWTVNSIEQAIKFKNLGVDGITTDRPAWMAKHFEDLEE